MKVALLGKSKTIKSDIDEFLNKLSEAGLLFEQMVRHFVTQGADGTFDAKLVHLRQMEEDADRLANCIGRALYTEMLIPDLRADVLSLIQDLDSLLDTYADIAIAFDIERPDHTQSSEEAHKMYFELLENTVKSVEVTVTSARAFFRDIKAVEDHVHKVSFYEAEVDNIAQRIKRDIFRADAPLELKLQYRYFIDALAELADNAKDAAEWISIYAIKRSL